MAAGLWQTRTWFAALALVAGALLLCSEAQAQRTDALPAPLKLEQVLRLAREDRAEIAAAKARARALAQRPEQVSALEDPMVMPAIDHLPFKLDGVDASLMVEQRFPLSRVRANRRRSAEAEARRAGEEADKVALDVELEAASAFLMLQERRELARILDVQRDLALQLVRASAARYAAGTGPQADALRAETELARFDGERRAVAGEVRAAEVMLNASLNRLPGAPIPALDVSSALAPPPAAELVREAALSSRPELRAAAEEIRRAQAETSVMQSMYSPMGLVRTGPSYTMDDGPGWMLVVGVSVPLWRGRLAAGVAEAEAMAEMARADQQAMRRMIEGEALSARETVIAWRERYLALRDDVVPRARQSIDPVLAAWATGQVPLVSVLDAAQVLWSAEGEQVQAQQQLGMAWARLQRAMGATGARP